MTLLIPQELIDRHTAWSENRFPGISCNGPLRHLKKEADEAMAQPEKIEEFADMAFLLLDALRRAGHTPPALVAAMQAKMPVLEGRHYEHTGGEVHEHKRTIREDYRRVLDALGTYEDGTSVPDDEVIPIGLTGDGEPATEIVRWGDLKRFLSTTA